MHDHNDSHPLSPPLASCSDHPGEAWPRPSIILEHVARTYALTVQDLQGKKRDALKVEARQVVIHLLAARGCGATGIGRLIRLDHSTVSHHLLHARLTRLQQQLIAELTTELHRMAEQPRIHRQWPTSGSALPGGQPRDSAWGLLTQEPPSLGEHSDRLLVIPMPCS